MKAEFYRPVSLAHLFDWTEPIWNKTNWLFVRLDSTRDISTTEKYLAPKLKEENILFEYKPEGLWLFSTEVVRPYVRDYFAVPFSACYIFDIKTTSCVKPSFDMTTLEHPFADSELALVSEEIRRSNALGYAADGCGLQWVSIDDELSQLIRQGFATWQEAAQKQS
jgi:hypothetical protein